MFNWEKHSFEEGKKDETKVALPDVPNRLRLFHPDRELRQFVQMTNNIELKHSPHLQAVIPPCEQNQ